MTPTQKDFISIFNALCRLHRVIRLHHSICNWNDGEILSIKMVTSNHWIVIYASDCITTMTSGTPHGTDTSAPRR